MLVRSFRRAFSSEESFAGLLKTFAGYLRTHEDKLRDHGGDLLACRDEYIPLVSRERSVATIMEFCKIRSHRSDTRDPRKPIIATLAGPGGGKTRMLREIPGLLTSQGEGHPSEFVRRLLAKPVFVPVTFNCLQNPEEDEVALDGKSAVT
jgi:hypothetical protein